MRKATTGKRTTTPGYVNRNEQVVLHATGLAGTDHCSYTYVLRCGGCDYRYGANGTDIFQRKCPSCQGGRPGQEFAVRMMRLRQRDDDDEENHCNEKAKEKRRLTGYRKYRAVLRLLPLTLSGLECNAHPLATLRALIF